MASSSLSQNAPPLKALIFDLMGTCLDWHSAIQHSLAYLINEVTGRNSYPETSAVALEWRQAFFDEISARFKAGLPAEDIDETHRRTLDSLLGTRYNLRRQNFQWEMGECVQAWHRQKAWPDVRPALERLRQTFDVDGYISIVLANGTARLQMDITKSAGVDFDLLLSSEVLGLTKPDPRIYCKAMELLKYKPEECMMVAAHAYDLRAAKEVGMRTAYIQRWTEDPQEDMEKVKAENDIFIALDSDHASHSARPGGLLKLVEMLGA